MDNQIIHLPEVKDIELTATIPQEMVQSQHELISWCEQKISFTQSEAKELEEAVAHAKKSKWKFTTLQKHYLQSVKKISFYQKVKIALENGFYIVPNFPIDLFAIRTEKKNVAKLFTYSTWGDKEQSAQELPEGRGEYKNPFPLVVSRSAEFKDGKEVRSAKSYAEDWDEFEFPLTMAKPVIMEATSRAMALKIFDQIGIMPAARKEDPVIIGQIKRKGNGYTEKVVSFMIAWHLNTNVL